MKILTNFIIYMIAFLMGSQCIAQSVKIKDLSKQSDFNLFIKENLKKGTVEVVNYTFKGQKYVSVRFTQFSGIASDELYLFSNSDDYYQMIFSKKVSIGIRKMEFKEGQFIVHEQMAPGIWRELITLNLNFIEITLPEKMKIEYIKNNKMKNKASIENKRTKAKQ